MILGSAVQTKPFPCCTHVVNMIMYIVIYANYLQIQLETVFFIVRPEFGSYMS